MALYEYYEIVFCSPKLDIIQFFQQHQLIKTAMDCKKCTVPMQLSEYSSRADGYIWRCPVRSCRSTTSLRSSSFFEKSKESLREWLLVMLEWARETPVTSVPDLVKLTEKTAIQMYQFLRDVCSWKLLNDPCLLGGPGCIVQIDETCVSRRQKVGPF